MCVCVLTVKNVSGRNHGTGGEGRVAREKVIIAILGCIFFSFFLLGLCTHLLSRSAGLPDTTIHLRCKHVFIK